MAELLGEMVRGARSVIGLDGEGQHPVGGWERDENGLLQDNRMLKMLNNMWDSFNISS